MSTHHFARVACWVVSAAGTIPAAGFAATPGGAAHAPDPTLVSQFQTLLLDGVGFLIRGAVFLAVGVVIAVLAALRAEVRDRVLLLFSAMSILWGLRFVCRSAAVRLLISGETAEWELFTRFLAYLSAPVAFAFVWQLFGPGWRSSVRVVTWISVTFALGASVLLLVVPDPDLLVHAFNVLVLVGVTAIAVSITRPRARDHPGLRKLIYGGLGSLVFIVVENARSLGIVPIDFDVEWIGVVILYGALGQITVGHFVGVEQKLATLRQELETARQIQASILPIDPPASPGLAVATRYLPMTDVAGDFFDFATIDNNRVGFLVADVSGHGVPAALVAAMVKVAFQAQAGHCDGPARVLSGMNEMLGHRLEEQFVTAGYACIDTMAGSIDYAGAGHPPLLIKSGRGEIEDLPASGLMLGPFPDAQYESTERRLAPGDRILMYTDGVVEAFNTKDEEFGERRLKDLLSAGASLSVEEFADRVLDEVKRWTGIGRNDSLDDDLTVIVIDVLAHQET